jgi:hypothetical protein
MTLASAPLMMIDRFPGIVRGRHGWDVEVMRAQDLFTKILLVNGILWVVLVRRFESNHRREVERSRGQEVKRDRSSKRSKRERERLVLTLRQY